jgi:hypothetical protein
VRASAQDKCAAKRSNKTHASTTDADTRLYEKSNGKESKLSYLGHPLVENRNGLIAAALVTHADGVASPWPTTPKILWLQHGS